MARFTAARLERESKLRNRQREPFEYESESPGFEGQVVILKDPNKLHYTQLRRLGAEGLDETMRILMGEDGYKLFVSFPEVDGELLADLFAAWSEHYSVDPGEFVASAS